MVFASTRSSSGRSAVGVGRVLILPTLLQPARLEPEQGLDVHPQAVDDAHVRQHGETRVRECEYSPLQPHSVLDDLLAGNL